MAMALFTVDNMPSLVVLPENKFSRNLKIVLCISLTFILCRVSITEVVCLVCKSCNAEDSLSSFEEPLQPSARGFSKYLLSFVNRWRLFMLFIILSLLCTTMYILTIGTQSTFIVLVFVHKSTLYLDRVSSIKYIDRMLILFTFNLIIWKLIWNTKKNSLYI